MSILIKGMNKSQNCFTCPFKFLNANVFVGCRLPNNCPLVEVPTPHGRLVDENQIPYIDLNSDMPQSKVRVWVAFKDEIDRLPTIIEAEEGAEA